MKKKDILGDGRLGDILDSIFKGRGKWCRRGGREEGASGKAWSKGRGGIYKKKIPPGDEFRSEQIPKDFARKVAGYIMFVELEGWIKRERERGQWQEVREVGGAGVCGGSPGGYRCVIAARRSWYIISVVILSCVRTYVHVWPCLYVYVRNVYHSASVCTCEYREWAYLLCIIHLSIFLNRYFPSMERQPCRVSVQQDIRLKFRKAVLEVLDLSRPFCYRRSFLFWQLYSCKLRSIFCDSCNFFCSPLEVVWQQDLLTSSLFPSILNPIFSSLLLHLRNGGMNTGHSLSLSIFPSSLLLFITTRVPQGSIFAPTFFVLHFTDLLLISTDRSRTFAFTSSIFKVLYRIVLHFQFWVIINWDNVIDPLSKA